jgi:hypothetical protein
MGDPALKDGGLAREELNEMPYLRRLLLSYPLHSATPELLQLL